jgi:hypothetical protein
MAAIAGGRLHGVAPNADMFLMKTKTHYHHTYGSGTSSTSLTYPALDYSLNVVEQHINDRLAQDPKSKSVINMSFGMLVPNLVPIYLSSHSCRN